jgi:DNA repair protein SbcC/Rad50
MINSISITNFQSHKESFIEFCNGLNIITGSSDSGKSGILRSFRWVYENRPSGDSIRNWSCKKEDIVFVKIELSEGNVYKERINGKTKYFLESKGGSQEFEAFKSDVPQEIIDIFNLSEFNIQTQHEPYFLLNDSPGEVAKKLNSLVGLDIIDTIFKNLNSKILGLKRSIDSEEENFNSLTKQINDLSWLDQAEISLNKVDEEQRNLEKDKTKFLGVLEIVKRCSSIKEELEEILPLKGLENTIKKMVNDLNNLKENQEKYIQVSSLIQSIENFKKDILEVKKQNEIENPILLLKKEIENYLFCEQRYEEVVGIISLLTQLQEGYQIQTSLVEESKTELKKVLIEYKICPFCGSSITEKKIKEIVK